MFLNVDIVESSTSKIEENVDIEDDLALTRSVFDIRVPQHRIANFDIDDSSFLGASISKYTYFDCEVMIVDIEVQHRTRCRRQNNSDLQSRCFTMPIRVCVFDIEVCLYRVCAFDIQVWRGSTRAIRCQGSAAPGSVPRTPYGHAMPCEPVRIAAAESEVHAGKQPH
jgi:hypothetical protein